MTQKEIDMKMIMIAVFTTTAAVAQTAPSQMPATDAEKIADALRAGPAFVTKDATLLDWPSMPGGNTAFFGRVRTNGPVFLATLVCRTMSPAALTGSSCSSSRTALPVGSLMCAMSEFHICMAASGCLTECMRREATTNSTLGHTLWSWGQIKRCREH
jgi:hypothetical protein